MPLNGSAERQIFPSLKLHVGLGFLRALPFFSIATAAAISQPNPRSAIPGHLAYLSASSAPISGGWISKPPRPRIGRPHRRRHPLPNETPLGLVAMGFFLLCGLMVFMACSLAENDSRWGRSASMLLFIAGIFFGWACWFTFKAIDI